MILMIAGDTYYCDGDGDTNFYDDEDDRGPYCGTCGGYVADPPPALAGQTNQY